MRNCINRSSTITKVLYHRLLAGKKHLELCEREVHLHHCLEFSISWSPSSFCLQRFPGILLPIISAMLLSNWAPYCLIQTPSRSNYKLFFLLANMLLKPLCNMRCLECASCIAYTCFLFYAFSDFINQGTVVILDVYKSFGKGTSASSDWHIQKTPSKEKARSTSKILQTVFLKHIFLRKRGWWLIRKNKIRRRVKRFFTPDTQLKYWQEP